MGSPSVSITSNMVDFTDSHYNYVRTRILAVNKERKFGGIVEARDWPLKETIPGAYYFLINSAPPNKGQGPGTNSWSSPLYGIQVQWAWTIIGTDIPQNSLMSNRGDRYRKNFAMIQEILQGFYPGFSEKLQFSMNGLELVSTSYIPKEMVWWTKPRFTDRIDLNTGILFGSAIATLTAFSPDINS